MPFLTHFNLSERPFSLTPNSELYFPSESHQEVLASLPYAIERGEGIVKVSGEVGTGKTLLCRLLTTELIKTKAVAYIINPHNDADWIIGTVCREFGLDPDAPGDPFHRLNEFLLQQYEAGRPAVLVIDEAQALGLVGLETVRRLTNLETDTSKLLQIVLFGQPELDRLLETRALRQLNQRIAFSFAIPPFNEETTIEYIRYRVIRSSTNLATADKLFEAKALHRIARVSRGIPRIVNVIADKSLLAAFSAGADRVDTGHVAEAVADSEGVLRAAPRSEASGWRLAAPVVGASLVIAVVGLWAIADAVGGAEWSLAAALLALIGGGPGR